MSGFSNPADAQDVDIATSGDTSEDADLQGLRLFGIITPDTLDGANLTFNVSVDGSTWVPLVDEAGSAISVAMAVDQAISLANIFHHFAPWRYLQLVSDATETGDRTFTLVTRYV